MPKTTRLTVTDDQRVPNIRELKDVDQCDFFLETDLVLQRTAADPLGTSIEVYDFTTATIKLLPGDLEVDVVEEVSVTIIND